MSSPRIINSIQFLRGIAAILVVVHHTGGFVKMYFSPTVLLGDLFRIGFAGVDLFFVISGFIIHFTSKKYLNNPKQLIGYLKKRLTRVFPIYWLITTIVFVAVWILPVILQKEIFNLDYPNVLIDYVKTYLLYPHHSSINAVSWTLSYELFFYLCFALLIISNRFVIVLITILSVSFINTFLMGNMGEKTNFNFFFSGYNFEFLFGFLISQLYQKIKIPPLLSILSIVMAVVVIIKFGYDVPDFDSYRRVFTFGVPSALILIGFLNLEQQQKISIANFWILLGDASYALYLIHFPMILLLNKLPSLFGYVLNGNEELMFSYFIIILIVLTGIFVHKFIEKPLSKFISSSGSSV